MLTVKTARTKAGGTLPVALYQRAKIKTLAHPLTHSKPSPCHCTAGCSLRSPGLAVQHNMMLYTEATPGFCQLIPTAQHVPEEHRHKWGDPCRFLFPVFGLCAPWATFWWPGKQSTHTLNFLCSYQDARQTTQCVLPVLVHLMYIKQGKAQLCCQIIYRGTIMKKTSAY